MYYINVFTFHISVIFQILSQAALAAHDCYEPSQPGPQTAYRNTAAVSGGSTVRQPHRLMSNGGNSISGAYSAAQNDLCGNSGGGSQYSSQHHIYMEVDPLYCSHQADPRYCPQLPHSSTQVELLLSSPGEEEEEEPCCSTPGLVGGGASSSNSSQSSSGYSTAPSDTYCYADQLNNSMTTTSPGRGEGHHQHQQQMGHNQRLVYYQGHPPHHHHSAGGGLVLRPAYAPGQHQHHTPPPLPLMPHHHGGVGDGPVGADAGNVVFSISQGCESRGTAPPGGGSTRRKGRTARKSHGGGGATGPRHSSGGTILLSSEHQLIRLDENHVI